MMLAMAVFVLSQSVSKNAVEAIAKSIDADVKPNSSIKQLTESILNQIDQLRKSSGEPPSPAVAPAPAQASGPRASRLPTG
jgi:methionine aminopeptidase